MSLSPDQESLVADSLRVWHVRRACQVATLSGPDGRNNTRGQHGDAALNALLRCLLYELAGDIAAVTLLDQNTQYFLAVVPRSALHNPHVSGEMRKWYGCQSISHEGGLCIRTITMKSDPVAESVFEIYDLTQGHTRILPVVDGTAASFRHYLGVPLSLRDGLRIGTLFVFRDQPAQEGLSRPHRHFMHETARQVVDQIQLSIEALESKRALRCSSAVLGLLDVCGTNDQQNRRRDGRAADMQSLCAEVYQHGAKLLAHAFELEGAIIQELPWSIYDASSKQPRKARLLGQHYGSEGPALGPLPDESAKQLLEAFPSGAVCHLLHSTDGCGTFAASVPGSPEFSTEINVQLLRHKTVPEQFVFLPLLNTYHHRHTAFVLGWAVEPTRVYSSSTDLLPLSAFGVTIMSQVRQIEEQLLNRKKNDFLGSVSHEMRSPLHGVMACLELVRGAESYTEQLELIDNASSCALQLGENIDNLLAHANIGSPSPSRELQMQLRLPSRPAKDVQSPCGEISLAPSGISLTTFIEDVVAKERSKISSMTPSVERRADPLSIEGFTSQAVVVVDSTPLANMSIFPESDVGVIVSKLLGNCLKFTRPTGCIRISLDADEADVRLLFRDSACGISPDFVHHKLFVPFAQQDPLDPGMGLGLSLVHSAVQRLGGTISFHTDEAEGTDFTVSLPKAHFDVDDQGSSKGVVDFSALRVLLLAPRCWTQDGDDRARAQRCLDAIVTSLTRTLSTWCLVDLGVITELGGTPDISTNIVFVLYSDFELIRNAAGEAFDNMKKVVFCPDQAAESYVQVSAPTTCITILGPIVPWKVVSALSRLSKMNLGQAMPLVDAVVASVGDPDRITLMQQYKEQVNGAQDEDASSHRPTQPSAGVSPTQDGITYTHREPKLLLVDDNAINLKVLEKFAKKCSKVTAVPAGGGKAAVEAFKTAQATQTFDIILLDLSMPEVSGFDVAVAVRELELGHAGEHPRTYIVALTGLISDKDRDAAFAAGVDEYVTKPASLKDVQTVIHNWRMIQRLE